MTRIRNVGYSPHNWCRTCVQEIRQFEPRFAGRRHPILWRLARGRTPRSPKVFHLRIGPVKLRSSGTRSAHESDCSFADWTIPPCTWNQKKKMKHINNTLNFPELWNYKSVAGIFQSNSFIDEVIKTLYNYGEDFSGWKETNALFLFWARLFVTVARKLTNKNGR